MSNDKSNKNKGYLDGFRDKVEEIEQAENTPTSIPMDSLDMTTVFAPSNKPKIISKAFTLRDDQVRDLAMYSKRAKKNESEFMRDLIDLVFEAMKKGES